MRTVWPSPFGVNLWFERKGSLSHVALSSFGRAHRADTPPPHVPAPGPATFQTSGVYALPEIAELTAKVGICLVLKRTMFAKRAKSLRTSLKFVKL